MIVLDTHIWIWYVTQSDRLTENRLAAIESHSNSGLMVCYIVLGSSKLVEKNRLKLTLPVSEWVELALRSPGIRLAVLTPEIMVKSTQLPPPIHGDPADQMIIATALVVGSPLLTADGKILQYPHVETI